MAGLGATAACLARKRRGSRDRSKSPVRKDYGALTPVVSATTTVEALYDRVRGDRAECGVSRDETRCVLAELTNCEPAAVREDDLDIVRRRACNLRTSPPAPGRSLSGLAPAPVAAPSLYDGVGVGRRSAAHMMTLEKITFTRENLETAEKQKLLTETLEKFLRAVEADPSTKFPFKTSKADPNGPCNEKKVVADFLNAGKEGGKKKRAVAMLRAVCELRGVQSEYLNEQAAAST